MSLLSELTRRNVVRVGIAYLVGAWLVLQVTGELTPILLLDEWVGRSVLLVLTIGFPIALILAWIFQLTPEGIKHESDIRQESPTPRYYGRKLDFLIIGGLAIALSYFLVDKFILGALPPEPISVPKPLTSLEGFEDHPALSPDGSHIAFSWHRTSRAPGDIYVRAVDGNELLQLTDTPDDEYKPVWSPDGSQIAFLRYHDDNSDEIIIKSILGGPEALIHHTADSTLGYGLDWSPDGEFLAYIDRDPDLQSNNGTVFVLSLETGTKKQVTWPESVTRSDESQVEEFHWMPRFSPDGKSLAFLMTLGEQRKLCVQDLHESFSHCPNDVPFETTTSFDWSQDSNDLIFVSRQYMNSDFRELLRIPASGGEARPLLSNLGPQAVTIARNSSVLVFMQAFADHNLWRIRGPAAAEPGVPERLIGSTQDDVFPHSSPDGSMIAFVSARTGRPRVFVAKSDGSDARQLGGADPIFPRWSPNGKQILFSSPESAEDPADSPPFVYLANAVGGIPQKITEGAVPSWSRDGKRIYYQLNTDERCSGYKLFKRSVAEGDPISFADCKIRAIEGPDNRLYFFNIDDMALESMPIGGGEIRVELKTSHLVAWDFSNEHLIYLDRNDWILKVREIATGETLDWIELYTEDTKPQRLPWMTFAVSADGQWITYTRLDRAGSDLMIVENFR